MRNQTRCEASARPGPEKPPNQGRWRRIANALPVAAVLLLAAVASGKHAPASDEFDAGTVEDRAALFDFLVESTMQWDAFASLPDHPYYRAHPKGICVVTEMQRHRDELLAADTAEKLWFALWKISNARKDTHLRITTVDGGLELPESLGRRMDLPVRFAVDYADLEDRFFFVADLAVNIEELLDGSGPVPAPGDRLIRINGRSAGEFVEAVRPYYRYSTENNFWWRAAADISRTRDYIPHDQFHGEGLNSLRLVLERPAGERYDIDLPYLSPREIDWQQRGEPRYPGFSRIEELSGHETFDLHLADDPRLRVVLLQWHGFRPDLPEAMDALIDYAQENDLLDHHVIVDATRSGGGSRGAYAVQRLQPRPFRTTFGNLKVSEAMERWVEDRRRIVRSQLGRYREGVDGGAWLLEWLETDVQKAIETRQRYTNKVPFKLAHLPRWSDGIVDPAPVHFRGGLTVWLSPAGGSHLDQFASQIVDNDLAHVMGMSTGGFSNTWQATEVLRFPTNGRPIVNYQWSLGHTLRPNGQILQYNPAEVEEYIPQTRENFADYHPQLLKRTLERLEIAEENND